MSWDWLVQPTGERFLSSRKGAYSRGAAIIEGRGALV